MGLKAKLYEGELFWKNYSTMRSFYAIPTAFQQISGKSGMAKVTIAVPLLVKT